MLLRTTGLVAVIAALACGCRERETTAPATPAAPPNVEPERALPPSGSANVGAAPEPTSVNELDAEPRDAAWAQPTETEIRRRFQALRGGKLERVECRRTQCRLTITGSPAAIAATVQELGGARGLHGFAKNVLLATPETQDDGTLVMRAVASFER